MSYRVVNGRTYSVGNFPQGIETNSSNKKDIPREKEDFSSLLNRELQKNVPYSKEKLIISKHAAERLESRNIELSKMDMEKINGGINKANEKGARDCLILYKDLALIANIKNRTVITAMDKESSRENVFTNIDSVVIL